MYSVRVVSDFEKNLSQTVTYLNPLSLKNRVHEL
jgi:hypothetical protein